MKHEDMERLIEAARDYNEPPDTPREAMWAVIRAASPELGGVDLDARRAERARRERLRRWSPWALGIAVAATLAIGFGLGRATRELETPALPRATASADRADGPSLAARLVAADHMGEAEALLTLFRASDRTDDRVATARWARDLLSTTRLLLDSRVADDPELAGLLSDLELVLVQIVGTEAGDDEGRELIEEGMDELQLMTKLRTAAAPPMSSEI